MAMYARAIAAAEGGDYTLAKETFTLLGDYKDCPYMIIYYNGRHYESQASGSNWKSWLSAAMIRSSFSGTAVNGRETAAYRYTMKLLRVRMPVSTIRALRFWMRFIIIPIAPY